MVLHLRRSAPNWEKAKCLGTAPIRTPGESEVYDPWFDEEDPSPVLDICNGEDGDGVCPIREACLHFALVNNERFGVWGGTSEQDRKAIRKKWRWKPGASEPRPEWTWYPPGHVQSLLSPRERSEIQMEKDDDSV
jgi:Transcription factor WhiB